MAEIPGVVYETGRGPDHEDDRRALWTVFNGEFNFTALQAKIACMKGDRVLGGHYHPNYRELFLLLAGRAVFRLVNPETQEVNDYPLAPGDRLLIPALVPHAAIVSDGGILVGCTEKPYISPEVNDVRFEVSPPTLG